MSCGPSVSGTKQHGPPVTKKRKKKKKKKKKSTCIYIYTHICVCVLLFYALSFEGGCQQSRLGPTFATQPTTERLSWSLRPLPAQSLGGRKGVARRLRGFCSLHCSNKPRLQVARELFVEPFFQGKQEPCTYICVSPGPSYSSLIIHPSSIDD